MEKATSKGGYSRKEFKKKQIDGVIKKYNHDTSDAIISRCGQFHGIQHQVIQNSIFIWCKKSVLP